MRWRLVVEVASADGVVHVHEVHSGGDDVASGSSSAMLGLTLCGAKAVLSSFLRTKPPGVD
jgi:hypothetical protein